MATPTSAGSSSADPPDRPGRPDRAARADRAVGQALLDDLVPDLPPDPTRERRRMFGSQAVTTHGKIVAFVDTGGALVVKLPAERADALVEAGAATRMQMGRGAAREWLGVPLPAAALTGGVPDGDPQLGLWRAVLAESQVYVASLQVAGRRGG